MSVTAPVAPNIQQWHELAPRAGFDQQLRPGFSFLDDRGWGYGLSVLEDGSYGWDGGFGTTWLNIPSRDMTVVVLTQTADESGLPAVCAEVIAAARADAT